MRVRARSVAQKEPAAPWQLAWVSVGLAFALQAYRFAAYLKVPQFWGEDGPYFFRDAYRLGVASLFRTCFGYLHLYARLLSLAATWLPLQVAPHGLIAGAALAQGICYLFIWSRRFVIPTSARVLFTLAVVLVPNGGEIPFTFTNAQWYLALALIILLLRQAPSTQREWATDSAWFVLLGFSGPFLLLFLPCVLSIRALTRQPMARFELGKWAVGGAVAVTHVCLWNLSERIEVSAHLNLQPEAWVATFTNLILGFSFAHKVAQADGWMGWPVLALLLAGTSPFVLFPSTEIKDRALRASLLLCGMVCYLGGLWENREYPYKLHAYGIGQRSFFVLYVGIAWLLILTLTTPRVAQVRRVGAAALLTISGFCGLLCGAEIMQRADFHWTAQVQQFQLSPNASFVNPPGWRFTLAD